MREREEGKVINKEREREREGECERKVEKEIDRIKEIVCIDLAFAFFTSSALFCFEYFTFYGKRT